MTWVQHSIGGERALLNAGVYSGKRLVGTLPVVLEPAPQRATAAQAAA